MRKALPRPKEEDSTSLGGWLFADSFLALMVIFLATISFVPALGGAVSNNASVGNIAGSSYSKGLNLVYEEFNADQIKKDIAQFAGKEGLPLQPQVIYVKVVGGFDAPTEKPEMGTSRALLFSAKLKNSSLSQFLNAKFDLGSSNKIKSNQVVLRLTLQGN